MKRGYSLLEILVAIVIVAIVMGAVVAIYSASNRTFQKTKPVSSLLEEVREALSTLDFVFSRWGSAVPCEGNNCTLNNPPADCGTSYPPKDPMCITIRNGNEAEFYANLYGMGFVVSVDTTDNTASLISCRLRKDRDPDKRTQNCYYVWKGDRVVAFDSTGLPVIYELSGLSNTEDNIDCLSEPASPNATININMKDISSGGSDVTLSEGMVITRVPHRIRLYVDNGWLMMDKTDMASPCSSDENAIRIARVQSFSIEKVGKGVKLNITFVSQEDSSKTMRVVRYFGR